MPQIRSQIRRIRPLDWASLVLGAALLAVISVTAIVVATDFDEGYNLVAARELAETGNYATVTAEGRRPFDPRVSTGPLVIAPAAGLFALAGEGVTKGRLISVGWAGLFLLLYWAVSRRAFGSAAAFWALAALAAVLSLFAETAAQFLGESTALALTFGGLLTLMLAPRRRWVVRSLVAGLLFGAAAATKTLFVAGAAGIVVWFIVEWALDRRRSPKAEIGAGNWAGGLVAVVAFASAPAAWWLVQAAFVGLDGTVELTGIAWRHYTSTAVTAGTSGPAIERTLDFAGRFGWPQLLLATAGVIAGLVAARRRSKTAAVVAVILAVSLPWWGWWLVISPNGVERRVLSAYVILGPLIGLALANVVALAPRIVGSSTRRRIVEVAAGAAVLLLVVLPGGVVWGASLPGAMQFRDQQQEAVAYLHGYGDALRPYGVGWWMAWDVAILLEKPLHNLENWDIRRRPWIVELIIMTPESQGELLENEEFVATLEVCCEVEYDRYGYRFYRLLIDDKPAPGDD